MPAILPSTAWLEHRGYPHGTSLNAEAMHFAIVNDATGQHRKCVIKFVDLQLRPGLICEGLGWLLAAAAGVDVPAFAAVLLVPLAKLALSQPLPPFLIGYDEYPAWCVEFVEGRSLSQFNRWRFWIERSRCLHARSTPVIASFDVWTDNRDRNFGNVIKSDNRYIAIDHETLLHSLLYVPRGISFELNSLEQQAQLWMTANQFLRFQCDMADAARRHFLALKLASAASLLLLQRLLPEPLEAAALWQDIARFLEGRAAPGWMANELRLTV